MTEAQLQAAIIELAQRCGYRVAHFRAAMNARGDWRTPVAADGKGFPDLVAVHPTRGVLWRELKSAKGRVSPEQQAWLDVLVAAGQDAGVWRPADWLDGTVDRALGLPVHQR